MEHFGTAGIRGSATTAVTPDLALRVGRAVGRDAADRGVTAVALGRDGRVTGPGLTAAVEAGLLSAGVDVVRVGTVPTPALALASVDRYGVMVTASHNPPGDNGLKLFADGVEFDAAGERRIEALLDGSPAPADWAEWGSPREADVIEDYRERVVDFASGHGASAEGLAVAVDCGCGTAGLATPQVLSSLGVEVAAVNAAVDGHFPARPSKPTPDTLVAFRRFVGGGEYDLGLAHDGDADRIVVIAGDGSVVHEDTIVAILAEHAVRASEAESPVVITTPNASARIDDRVEVAGGRTTRVALGGLHEGVAAARAAGEPVAFAAEPWKHLHPELGGWIDGVASAALLVRLVAQAGGLAPLRDPVAERPYRKESVACPDAVKRAVMDALGAELPAHFPDATVDREHGIRLDRPDGSWVLVRPSGTEPKLRLYAEGPDVDALVGRAREAISAATATAGADGAGG